MTDLGMRWGPVGGGDMLDLDAERIGTTLAGIAAIGNRWQGSVGEREARCYLLERFEQLGLADVRVEPFDYLGYDAGPTSCRVLGPVEKELRCGGLQYSAAGTVEGPIALCGAARDARDLEELLAAGLVVEGRIVLLATLYAGELTPWLVEHGALAVIATSPAPDGLLAHFIAGMYPPPLAAPWPGRPTGLPGVTLEHDDALLLTALAAASREVVVRLEHEPTYTARTSANVVGDLPGEDDRHVVLGAHYDSQIEGPCVWDNGSGLAGVLEIARRLSFEPRPAGLRVVAFGIEEAGMWGSSHYVAQHVAELDQALGMVDLDGAGSSYPSRHSAFVNDSVRELALDVAARCQWPVDDVIDAAAHPYLDSHAFAEHGVPACMYAEYPPLNPYYHSSGDVAGLLDPRRLATTAGVAGTLVQALMQTAVRA